MLFVVSFLLTSVMANPLVASHLQNSNNTLPKPHMIIVGPTGAGKSSLANALIGDDPTCEDCLFPVCTELDSCTKHTNYCGNRTWLGFEENPLFTVVDTPGFGDSDDEMDELLEEMIGVLNEDVETADAIVLTIPAGIYRFNKELIDMLKELEMLFGRKMWNSTIIEISMFSYKQRDIDDRNEDCEEDPHECRDEAFFYNEINRQIEENFHIGINLSICFIDSYARKDTNKDDETQQMHFIEETDKLWNFAMSSPEFKFKTIDEILEENSKMKDEIECLNGVITKDIKELHDMIEQEKIERVMQVNQVSLEVDTLKEEMEDNVDGLKNADEELQDQINSNVSRLDGDINGLKANVEELSMDVDAMVWKSPPIGTIMSWVSKPEVHAEYSAALPYGWMFCDGTEIPEPSPWAGKLSPDLNGKGLFLRGGNEYDYPVYQEDQIEDLGLSIIDNKHTHYDSGHDHISDDYYADVGDKTDDSDDNHNGVFRLIHATHHTTTSKAILSSDSANIELKVNNYRRGSETRPKNAQVTWIMRVME